MASVAQIDKDAALTALWTRIAAHDFEPSGRALTFVGRLARDHGWTTAAAHRAVEEYRRFCFLAVTSATPMTPIEEVDEVWHLHLTFTRDYWDVWCGAVLGAPFHHDPTTGSRRDAGRFPDQYARTLARYEALFGPPDPVLWPGVAERFAPGPRFRTIDLDRALVVPLPTPLGRRMRRLRNAMGLATLLSVLAGGPARALPLDVLDWPGKPVLVLYGLAPLPHEVATAFAVAGATALAGTVLADYAPFFTVRRLAGTVDAAVVEVGADAAVAGAAATERGRSRRLISRWRPSARAAGRASPAPGAWLRRLPRR